jgi:hypothetical protein
MKKLCTLFVLLSLAATAGPPPTPTLSVSCAPADGGCSQPEFHLTNLDPKTTYRIEGANSTESLCWDTELPSADGIVDLPTGGFLDQGTWTFELHAMGHNGKEQHKILTIVDATF